MSLKSGIYYADDATGAGSREELKTLGMILAISLAIYYPKLI